MSNSLTSDLLTNFLSNIPYELKTKLANLTPHRKRMLINRLLHRNLNIHFVFEDVSDPHNLMAATRSIDAFGFQYVHIIFNEQKGFNPRKIGKKTSASANKWLSFYRYHSLQEAIRCLKSKELILVATTLSADSIPLNDFIEKINLNNRYAILFGNEHRGLSKELIETSDLMVSIPMVGFVESLNLSVSVAIIAWELYKTLQPPKYEQQPPYNYNSKLLEILKEWTDK